MRAGANVYLEACLQPFARHLGRSDVTDVYVNRPGELWIETQGGSIERVFAPELTDALLNRFARQVAAMSGQGINRDQPLLAASLPGGERVQIVLPPATRQFVAIAIRKHVPPELTLEDYRSESSIPGYLVPQAEDVRSALERSLTQAGQSAMLSQAVRARRNILVSGGTSSGKTTFLNVLMREVPSHERLILIEDAAELQPSNANSIGLIASRGLQGQAELSAEDLLIAALRMRPDRIILGEIRGAEATTFLRAINTGHPGSLSTIHADSPLRAIDQLALLVLQTGIRMNWGDVVTYVRRSIDIIVQLKRGSDRRQIDSVYVVEA